MIRIIIDKLGSGDKDLFLKIDALPVYTKIVDSYYIFDFLEINKEKIEELNLNDKELLKLKTRKLIDYWIDRIQSIAEGHKKFIPFDLSDEYIGGLMLERTKIGFKTKIVFTDQIHGYGICISNLDKQISNKKVNFLEEEQVDWLIGKEAIFEGLYWSRNELL